MGLNVSLQALTQPGSTGNQTISLAANFDPKVIILWSSGAAAAGTAAHAQFGFGFGTYRGAAVQQGFVSIDARDAATTGNTCAAQDDNALLCLLTAASPGSRDMEIQLVSMQTGATSQVVINWVNLHTTASIKVNCLILGGSDITDANIISVNTPASSPQDVTVVSGFGQPDLLFAIASSAFDDLASTECFVSIGFGKKGEAGRNICHGSFDGNTLMGVVQAQRSNVFIRDTYLSALNTVGEDSVAALDTTTANWPTDGFRLIYTTTSLNASRYYVLAIKGTFTSTTGAGTAPTAGSPPVVQDLAHGSVPKLAFMFGWNRTATTSTDNTGTDLGAFFVGAGDGTTELSAGVTDDDGAGTSVAKKHWTNAKVIQNYNVTPTLQSEADGSISGNNFRLSWSTVDTVAREYQWLTLGDVVGDQTISPTGIATSEALGTHGIKQTAGPTGIASSEALGSPSVGFLLSPTAIASSEAIGTAGINQTAGPTGIASQEALGAPSSQLSVAVTGLPASEALGSPVSQLFSSSSGIPSQEALGAPSILAVLDPTGIASSETLGAPSVRLTASVTSIASGEAVGSAVIHSSVATSGVASGEALGAPSILATASPTGIASTAATGTPALLATVRPTGIASNQDIGNVTVTTAGGPQTIFTDGIDTSEALGSPGIKQTAGPTGIASSEALGSSSLQLTVAPSGVASSEAIGSPGIGQTASPTGIASSEAIGSPTIGLTLIPLGIASFEALGSPGFELTIGPLGIASLEVIGDATINAGAPPATVLVIPIPSSPSAVVPSFSSQPEAPASASTPRPRIPRSAPGARRARSNPRIT